MRETWSFRLLVPRENWSTSGGADPLAAGRSCNPSLIHRTDCKSVLVVHQSSVDRWAGHSCPAWLRDKSVPPTGQFCCGEPLTTHATGSPYFGFFHTFSGSKSSLSSFKGWSSLS